MKAVVAGMFLAGILLATPARGTEDAPTRLSLDVHAACTDEADFWRRVRARTHRLVAGEGEGVIAVAIAIEASGARTTGTLRVLSDGEPVQALRRVEGASCEDVADALSLIFALTFDPDALTTEPTGQGEERSAPEIAMPDPQPEGHTPEIAKSMRRDIVREALPSRNRWRTMAGARATVAAIDGPPLGGGVFVEGASGTVRPIALRLEVTMLETTVTAGERSARYRWFVAVPEVCPFRLRSGPLTLLPCVGVAMGALVASPGIRTPNDRTFLRPWVAPRALARGRLALAAHVGLEVDVALDAAVVRNAYEFGSDRVYRIPFMFPTASIGVVVEL